MVSRQPRAWLSAMLGIFVSITASCSRAPNPQSRPANAELATFPSEWTYRPGAKAPLAEHGMVVSNCALATQAGVEILQAGGNAVDASVAVGFVLAVAYPEAGNIGGGGYAVLMALGGRGGPLIITSVAQAIVNTIDYRMSLADALGAPRIHDQALPDVIQYEKGGFSDSVIAALKAMGYTTQPGGTGSLTAIKRVDQGWEGMFDPRKHGLAAGY